MAAYANVFSIYDDAKPGFFLHEVTAAESGLGASQGDILDRVGSADCACRQMGALSGCCRGRGGHRQRRQRSAFKAAQVAIERRAVGGVFQGIGEEDAAAAKPLGGRARHRFVDVTRESGIDEYTVSLTANAFDFDRDGKLDLILCNAFETSCRATRIPRPSTFPISRRRLHVLPQ